MVCRSMVGRQLRVASQLKLLKTNKLKKCGMPIVLPNTPIPKKGDLPATLQEC